MSTKSKYNYHCEYEEQEHDNVNSPQHYLGKVECIDCIESAVSELTGFEGYCTGNAIKYLYRWKKKNGIEDLKKAKWYIDKIISIEGK